jgi:hypothetical protein
MTAEEEALIRQAIDDAEKEKEEKRAAKRAEAAPVWSNLFAKKLPPLCTVHQKPCRDFSESEAFAISHLFCHCLGLALPPVNGRDRRGANAVETSGNLEAWKPGSLG